MSLAGILGAGKAVGGKMNSIRALKQARIATQVGTAHVPRAGGSIFPSGGSMPSARRPMPKPSHAGRRPKPQPRPGKAIPLGPARAPAIALGPIGSTNRAAGVLHGPPGIPPKPWKKGQIYPTPKNRRVSMPGKGTNSRKAIYAGAGVGAAGTVAYAVTQSSGKAVTATGYDQSRGNRMY